MPHYREDPAIREIQKIYARPWTSAVISAVLAVLWLVAVITAAVLSEGTLAARMAAVLRTWCGWGALAAGAVSGLQFAYFWAHLRMLASNNDRRD